MNTSIQDAINQAQAAASNFVPAVAQSGGVPAQAPVKAAPLSVDDMMTGSMAVDGWLKVNYYGLFVGGDKTPFTKLKLRLKLSDVAYNYAIKFGNPAQYLKTYDRVNCSTGGSWADAQARASRIDPKASEYRSADLPFVLTEDIKGANGVILEAGKTLGHALSTTGWTAFSSLIKKLRDDGIDVNTAVVDLEVGYDPKKTVKGEWGILSFLSYEEVMDA